MFVVGKYKFVKHSLLFVYWTFFFVFFLELILPDYAKRGLFFPQNNQRVRVRMPAERRRPKVKNFAHHEVHILADPWFFKMVEGWRKRDTWFLQKWKKALQKWTYRDLPIGFFKNQINAKRNAAVKLRAKAARKQLFRKFAKKGIRF